MTLLENSMRAAFERLLLSAVRYTGIRDLRRRGFQSGVRDEAYLELFV